MESEMDSATFQGSRSEFVEVVKYLIKELVQHIASLEDVLYMLPATEIEKRSQRAPYRSFRKTFRELFALTRNTARNQDTVKAVSMWFSLTRYDAGTKVGDFADGIDLAELWISEMYRLGLLDMNVSEPVDFPFDDIIQDIIAEHGRREALDADYTKVEDDETVIDCNALIATDFIEPDIKVDDNDTR